MPKAKRFHLYQRRENELGSQYTHNVIVLKIDDYTEIELGAGDINLLIDDLMDARKTMGWEPFGEELLRKVSIREAFRESDETIEDTP